MLSVRPIDFKNNGGWVGPSRTWQDITWKKSSYALDIVVKRMDSDHKSTYFLIQSPPINHPEGNSFFPSSLRPAAVVFLNLTSAPTFSRTFHSKYKS